MKKKEERSSILPLLFKISLNLLTLWYSQKHLSACYKTTLHFYYTLSISNSEHLSWNLILSSWNLILSLRYFSAKKQAPCQPWVKLVTLASRRGSHSNDSYLSSQHSLMLFEFPQGLRQRVLYTRNLFDDTPLSAPFCLPGSGWADPYLAFPIPNKKQKRGKVGGSPKGEVPCSTFIIQPMKITSTLFYPEGSHIEIKQLSDCARVSLKGVGPSRFIPRLCPV